MTGEHLTTVTSYGPRAGSARVRVFDWIEWLHLSAKTESYLGGSSNSAFELIHTPGGVFSAELRLRKLAASPPSGTILLARRASPFSSGWLEERILRRADRGVYDFDDALMHSPVTATERLWSKRETWRRAVSAADQVIAGNSILASAASEFSDNVTVIPSCVDPQQYTQKQTYEIENVPRAVWLGSPSTEQYLQLIAPALLQLNASHGLRLTVISAGAALLGALEPLVDRVAWDFSTFAGELAKADFGIMPLADNAWARGKCAYKLLQYGASSLPLVGSPVGANEQVLKDANGFAPTSADEWVAAVEALLSESSTVRETRGRLARQTVIDKYSFQAWDSAWERAVGL